MKPSLSNHLKRQKTIIIREKEEVKPGLATLAGRWVVRAFAVFGFMLFLSLTFLIIVIAASPQEGASHPEDFILTHHFDGGSLGGESVESLLNDPFAPPPPDLNRILLSIRAAAEDDRVKGLAVQISDGDHSMAMIEEIHAAMAVFRKSGKPSLAYSHSYGMLSNGTGEYLLASAFDTIWLGAQGDVSPTGFYVEIPYYKDALERFGIQSRQQAMKEYKTGANMALRNSMSEEQTLMLNDMLDNSMRIAARLLEQDVETVQALFDAAPYHQDQALELGLIDRVARVRDVPEHFDGLSEAVTIRNYRPPKVKTDPNRRIALVRIDGMLLDFEAVASEAYRMNPFGLLGESFADSRAISDHLYDLAEDDDVHGVVLQIDSPGGTPQAAEMIRQAALTIMQADKPVFVSMGSTAASGGYWIAADADRIWALPSTATGSIGVYGGKYDLSGLWNKLGVTWETASRGARADLWSFNRDYSREGRAAMRESLSYVYDYFVSVVAKGRDMEIEAVEEIAKGRVWTGVAAVENGLVDSLGGIDDVLQAMKLEIGLEEGEKAALSVYPQADDGLDRLLNVLFLRSPVMPALPLSLMSLVQSASMPWLNGMVVMPGIIVIQ